MLVGVMDYLISDQEMDHDPDAVGDTHREVDEASPSTTFNVLKGLKTYQVVIMNNYYRGKYSDYSGRYYYVLAHSPEEAKQVVLDNADGILQELLAMKSHNGKKILPRGSAVRITPERIGKIEDGTVAGRMSTAGFKKMFGPEGQMMVKLSGGNVVDIQGEEQGVTESSNKWKVVLASDPKGESYEFDAHDEDHANGVAQDIADQENAPVILLFNNRKVEVVEPERWEGMAEGSGGDWYAMALKRHPQLKQVDREKVIDALNDAYEDYLFDYGYEGIGPDEENSLIDYAVKRLKQDVAEAQVNEKSKSQAQFRTMAAVAHNPKFAKKVGISQKVGKEFHSADKKSNYKSLPKKVDEGEGNLEKALDTLGGSWSGWYPDENQSDPNVKTYWYDDGEGGHYASGNIEHNLKTGQVTVDFADEYNDEVKGTFKNMGDAMRALRGGYPGSHGGKAPNFDRLGNRAPIGPDELRKTDRTGRKGTISGHRANTMKAASPGRINGPVGVLPESDISEDKLASDLYKDLQIFKKALDKGIGSKAKDKEISSKAKDKEIQKKK